MTKEQFIKTITAAVKKIAPGFGIKVYSPIIAQACLESAYGTSSKAKHNNFFGLKYREGRVSCHSGTFVDDSSEQLANGSYVPITDQWYAFDTVEAGIRGYFQFISTPRYKNLIGVSSPKKYLKLIKADGYATSLNYVDNVYNVIISNNLQRFDKNNSGGKVSSMKYHDGNKPIVCMQTNSTCYRGTKTMVVKGVLFHSTGCNNPTIKRYVQPSDEASDYGKMIALLGKNTSKTDWNHASVSAGLNAWIGKLADGTVATVQTMPWNYRPWGCGSGSRGSCNDGWIQFEICEDGLNDKEYFNKVYNEAVELTAYLCKLYGLNPNSVVSVHGVSVPVITCHADAHKLGFGTNHGDINHWFPKYGKSMKTVRADVAKLLSSKEPTTDKYNPVNNELYKVRKRWSDDKSQIGVYKVLANAKKACKKGYSVFDSKGNVVYTAKSTSNVSGVSATRKTVKQLAKEVWAGKWGSGTERKRRLEAAGYSYNEVQAMVNKLYG